MVALWLAAGVIAKSAELPAITARGDDAGRSKRPILDYRPKVERELEQILETIEDAPVNERTSVKRRIVKEAREAVKAIEAPPDVRPAIAAISAALSALSRAAGEYAEFQAAQMRVAMMVEALIAAMERKRIKRRKEEEAVIAWLLS